MKDKDKDKNKNEYKDSDSCNFEVPVPLKAGVHEIVGAIEDALTPKATDLTNCANKTVTINIKFR